jgi:hypothetical protein
MSNLWTAEVARMYAAAHLRPVVTRVDSDMWVMYPPKATEPVRGGYPADTAERAQQITEPIACRVWGLKPLIVDKMLVGGAKK